METRSAADVHGPWVDPGFPSSLIQRCEKYWNVPIGELPNQMLACFLQQKIAVELVLPEARRRIAGGIDDGSELYDGQLAAAVQEAGDR